ncbi:MAG TPA: carotenoid biosynthesis protein [Blastocatellia bacterium]|nr:carotenoid biosynthesis protein [Blastocatellia bacterium]
MEFIHLMMGTVALRPYVFVFFAIYLFIAITSIGLKRTFLFTAIAYLIAFVCEYSSTHFSLGIPFGVYHYVESTRGKELWIAGVPFMDSLSFTFLSFISYRLSLLLIGTLIGQASASGARMRPPRLLYIAVLAGFLMMYLDIIIDPVTLQGKRWFLGEIYLYPVRGPYFGVTLANFLGWFIVGLAIVVVYCLFERRLKGSQPDGIWHYPFQDIAPVALYFGILAFNLSVTFYIAETSMGFAGVFITMPLLLLVIFTAVRKRSASVFLSSQIDAITAVNDKALIESDSTLDQAVT